jgi:dolichol-phosphate mannosyltransferase
VLIILPVLNEAGNIAEVLAGLGGALGDRPHTICVIDDGSVDGTVEKVLTTTPAAGGHIQLLRRTKTRAGCQRGAALRAGLEWGVRDPRVEAFVEIDGDRSHRVEELAVGLDVIDTGRADVAIASKYLPGSRVLNRSKGRRLVSRVCSLAASLMLDRAVADYSNGYRFYNRHAAMLAVQHRLRYGSPIYLSEVLRSG